MINRVLLIGEVKEIKEYKGYCTISLETNEPYGNKDSRAIETQIHTIQFLGEQAENIVKTLKVGFKVIVEARIIPQISNSRYKSELPGYLFGFDIYCIETVRDESIKTLPVKPSEAMKSDVSKTQTTEKSIADVVKQIDTDKPAWELNNEETPPNSMLNDLINDLPF
jgi:hypothetical protein